MDKTHSRARFFPLLLIPRILMGNNTNTSLNTHTFFPKSPCSTLNAEVLAFAMHSYSQNSWAWGLPLPQPCAHVALPTGIHQGRSHLLDRGSSKQQMCALKGLYFHGSTHCAIIYPCTKWVQKGCFLRSQAILHLPCDGINSQALESGSNSLLIAPSRSTKPFPNYIWPHHLPIN